MDRDDYLEVQVLVGRLGLLGRRLGGRRRVLRADAVRAQPAQQLLRVRHSALVAVCWKQKLMVYERLLASERKEKLLLSNEFELNWAIIIYTTVGL